MEISARKNEKMQMMKMQEWKYRPDSAGVENAGVEKSARFCSGGKCGNGNIGTVLQGWKMRELKLSNCNKITYKLILSVV